MVVAQADAAPLVVQSAGTSRRLGFALLLAALATASFAAHPHAAAHFRLSDFTSAQVLPDVVLPTRLTTLTLAALVLALAIGQIAFPTARRRLRSGSIAFAIAAVVGAFLCWAVAGRSLSTPGLMGATINGSLPLIFGALTGVLCERAGVINIAIEGQFLLSAFAASTFASLFGVWVGILSGSLAGGLVGACLAVLAIRFFADQVVVGIVLTLLITGLTNFLYLRVIVPHPDTLTNPPILPNWRIPGLASIPVVGVPLFDQNLLWYLAVALLLALQLGLFRTRWGLRVQAVGENPDAAESVGISIPRTRYRNVIIGGLVAGLGGTFLTIGSVGAFQTGISSGKGFIALAAVIFGRWRPLAACGAAVAFGFTDAAQSQLSVIGAPIPSTFLQMFPYLVTIAALAGLVGRVRPPAADGKPWIK